MTYRWSQPQLKCPYGRKSEVENWKQKVKAEAHAGRYNDVFSKHDIFKENWHFLCDLKLPHFWISKYQCVCVCLCFCVSVCFADTLSSTLYVE